MKTIKEIINELAEAVRASGQEQHRLCFVVALTELYACEKRRELDAAKRALELAAKISRDNAYPYRDILNLRDNITNEQLEKE